MVRAKLIASLVAAFFVFSVTAFASVSIEKLPDGLTYNFTVEDVEQNRQDVDGREVSRLTLKGVAGYEGILYRVGYPEIPVIRVQVEAEKVGDIIITANTLKANVESMMVGADLMPVIPSAAKYPGVKTVFTRNEAFYAKDTFWPTRTYDIADAGSVKGVAQKLVTLYPVSYNPATSEIRVLKSFTVKVNGLLALRKENSDKAPLMAFIVGKKFADSPSVARYMQFKEERGLKTTKIVVGGAISTPDNIRKEIKGLYKSPSYDLQFVLLVGDIEDVPSRTAANIHGVSDHYYRAIDTDTYDSDIGGADIGVGRISVTSESQLSGVIDKFIRYQTTNAIDGWTGNWSFLGTNDRYLVAEGSHNYVIDTYTKNAGYTGYFPTANNPGGDQLYAITYRATGADLKTAFNLGRALIDYSGHGATTFWDAPRFTQSDVRAMKHVDALPFVISNACITGNFAIPESFAETWIRHPYGAIAFWGSVDSSYWDEDDLLERSMADGIFVKKNATFGKITDFALAEVWKYYGGEGRSKYYMETYTLFGDPSIKFRLN